MKLSEFNIRITYPDYPTGYPISEGYYPYYICIRIKYPNSYMDIRKNSRILKNNIRITIRPLSVSQSVSRKISVPFTPLLITCVRITWAIGPLCNFTRYYVSSILRPAISHRRPFCKLAKKQAT